jgi:hypothetical protein
MRKYVYCLNIETFPLQKTTDVVAKHLKGGVKHEQEKMVFIVII